MFPSREIDVKLCQNYAKTHRCEILVLIFSKYNINHVILIQFYFPNIQKPEASCNLELYNLQKDPCEKANLVSLMENEH